MRTSAILLVLLLAYAYATPSLAFVAHHQPHRYVGHNAGLVLWDCGPGLEVKGSPGLFWARDCPTP